MKFSILQSKLKEALNIIERIASKSPSLPILGNVLIEAKDNFLKLSATNLEIGVNFWLLAKVEKPGKITIPAHIFSSSVNYLSPSTTINAEEKNGVLSLECNNTKTRINGVSAEDFPIIPNVEKNENASIESFAFSQGLLQLISIASLSTVKPEISGIYHHFSKNSLTLAATDSFRLGERKIIFKKPLEVSKEYFLILPQRSASLLASIFGEKDIQLNLYFSPNLLMFESSMEETDHPKIQFVSKLIEGEYPQYQEIIPQQYKTEAIINRNDFLNQLKAASLFASRINEVKLKMNFQEQKVEIFCQNPELGEYSSSFPVEIKGKETDISFNYRFLLDGLANIKSEKVLFAFSEERENEEGPAILKGADDRNYLYVVMPIQPA